MTESAVISQWTIELQENDEGDLFIELNDDIIDVTGLFEGEKLIWEILSDDTFVLRRMDDYENQ